MVYIVFNKVQILWVHNEWNLKDLYPNKLIQVFKKDTPNVKFGTLCVLPFF